MSEYYEQTGEKSHSARCELCLRDKIRFLIVGEKGAY